MPLQDHSLISCSTCKARKRKCDKRVPQCTLCSRKGLNCQYNQQPRHQQHRELLRHQNVFKQSAAPSTPALIFEPAEEEPTAKLDPLLENVEFPAVYFLDSKISRQYQVDIPKANIPIPAYVRKLIGDFSSCHKVATSFFETTHDWMPIVSKKRFFEHLNPFTPLRADYALLILCMSLITWVPGPQTKNPHTTTYLSVKRYYLDLEVAGVLSIQALQAGIFIALFELGHAIYPSAFLSTASCARYGSALGLDWRTSSPWKQPFSWVDAEERNRVWWAIVLLDRALNLGRCERPLMIPDPHDGVFVPGDDAGWDQGIVPSTPMHSIETPRSEWGGLGPFGLVAQATRLLGMVLKHVSEDPPLDEEEAILLDGALKALIKVLDVEPGRQQIYLMNQQAICSCALLLLHEAHASIEQKTSTSVHFDSIHQAKLGVADIRKSVEGHPEDHGYRHVLTCVQEASPFLLITLYQAASAHLRMHRETRSKESFEALELVKKVMRTFDGRWKAAGAYLKILEAREMASELT